MFFPMFAQSNACFLTN